jgi:hypothetical protein
MKRVPSVKRTVPKIRPPRWEYAVLSLIVMGLIVLGVWGFLVSNELKEPRRVSDRFVLSILSNDAPTAYELTSEPYRQATNPVDFRAIVSNFNETIKTQPKVKRHTIERSKSDVLIATVEYEIPGTSGNRLIVKLIKENDNWRVLNINHLR